MYLSAALSALTILANKKCLNRASFKNTGGLGSGGVNPPIPSFAQNDTLQKRMLLITLMFDKLNVIGLTCRIHSHLDYSRAAQHKRYLSYVKM